METAFVDMINAHRQIIYKVCNLYFTEEEDKKDLFQEIVLQLWKAYPSFRNESLRTTWMYRIALNTAITSFRKAGKKPAGKPLSPVEFEIPDLIYYPGDNERLSILMRAIQQLSRVEKAIIILYLEEKSYEDISEIMGITKVNIGVKLNRIRTKLETIIQSIRHELR